MDPESSTVNISMYFNDICRLCLNKGTLQMLKHLEGDFISSIIYFLEVLLGHKLPDTICDQCFKDLTQMALFIRKCKHSQSILQQIEEECAKLQTTNHIQIEILDSEPAEETTYVPETLDFQTTDIKAEHEICEDDLTVDENDINLSEENFLQDMALPIAEDDDDDDDSSTDIAVTSANQLKICEKCGEIVTKMKDHYKMSKSCQPKNIKCTECNMYFSKTERLRGHRIAHHWKETYSQFMCHICSQMFKYEVNLKRHLQVHEVGARFICEICGKGYTTKVGLQDHVNLHTGDKPFACSFCDKNFSLRSVRNLHQRTHARTIVKDEVKKETLKVKRERYENYEYTTCDICNKEFVHSRALSLHKLSHDENRVFTCHTCDKHFPSKLLLMRHYATHKEKKMYECSCCKKSFKIRSYLATHMRSHTGERPFACKLCPKSFTQRAHLSYHMLLHKNEKSFVCKYCDKSFTLKGNLTVHLRIHTGERPYKCHVCDQGFRDSSARKRHVISKHGIEQVAYIRTVDINEM